MIYYLEFNLIIYFSNIKVDFNIKKITFLFTELVMLNLLLYKYITMLKVLYESRFKSPTLAYLEIVLITYENNEFLLYIRPEDSTI